MTLLPRHTPSRHVQRPCLRLSLLLAGLFLFAGDGSRALARPTEPDAKAQDEVVCSTASVSYTHLTLPTSDLV